MQHIKEILILNQTEAEKIAGSVLKSYQDIERCAYEILSSSTKSVLIIASPLDDADFNQTYWTNGAISFWLSSQRQQRDYRCGVQSVFSSVIMACLTAGHDITDAVVIAQMYVNQASRLSPHLNTNVTLSSSADWPDKQQDLPFLVDKPINKLPIKFSDSDEKAIGLYPIIDSVQWLEKLLSTDVGTVQLRIKDKYGIALEREIQQGIQLAKKHNIKLFINDYWQLAIRYGAYGVHLGQEDLNSADVSKIYSAGLRLGISTHCHYEVARAHAFRPSYIACGPIFPTTSKLMSFAPQGIAQLKYWRRVLDYPLVAIGGINLTCLPEILATNVEGIALISAITQATDPMAATRKLLSRINQYVPQVK